MSGHTSSSAKLGLLIGINQYPNLGNGANLDGCVNDVKLMAEVLKENFGFSYGDLNILLDDQATREAILVELDRLAERAGKDSIVVIHYSGHGSERVSKDNNRRYKPSGMDQTIVPHDSGRGSQPNRDIIDDVIYTRLLRLSEVTPYITFICDSCHSGTIIRAEFRHKIRFADPDFRPVESYASGDELAAQPMRLARNSGRTGWLPLSDRYVLLASCRDEESAFEYRAGSAPHGAFTHFLCAELIKAEPEATFRDIYERVHIQVSSRYPSQHPQIEGAWDRVLFSARATAPARYVFVQSRGNGKVTLSAGAAHGLRPGSVWGVYPPGTRMAGEGRPRLGRVQIDNVRAVTTDASITEESPLNAITASARAFEEEHCFGSMRLPVKILASDKYRLEVGELITLIENSPLLQLAKGDEQNAVKAYLLPGQDQIAIGSPVPQLVVTQPTWVAVGADGLVCIPTCPLTEVDQFIANLEKKARYQNALALDNPNTLSRLKGKIKLALKRLNAAGAWETVSDEEAESSIVYKAGDWIAFELTNNSDHPLYCSILDFGISGAISLLYPPRGAKERLMPGHCIEVGTRPGQEIELYLPERYPYDPGAHHGSSVEGTEIVKLFATTQETDFWSLLQGGYRDRDKAGLLVISTHLAEILDMALSGSSLRDARPVTSNEEWTTVSKSFTLRG